MSIQIVMAIHLIVIKIFQFGPKRWTSQPTDQNCQPMPILKDEAQVEIN